MVFFISILNEGVFRVGGGVQSGGVVFRVGVMVGRRLAAAGGQGD